MHIHVKIRLFNGLDQAYEFTSQFFFDETFTDDIYKLSAYAAHPNRDTRNTSDGIYNGPSNTGTAITSGSGSKSMLTLRKKSAWVEGDARLICDLSLGSSPDQNPGDSGPGGPPGDGGPPGGGGPSGR